jgi:hypothetical protein
MTTTTEAVMKRQLTVMRSEGGAMWGIWTPKTKRWQYFNAEDFERIRDAEIQAAKRGTLRHESDRFGPSPRPAA